MVDVIELMQFLHDQHFAAHQIPRGAILETKLGDQFDGICLPCLQMRSQPRNSKASRLADLLSQSIPGLKINQLNGNGNGNESGIENERKILLQHRQ